jgi:predicted NACHT family NTPase
MTVKLNRRSNLSKEELSKPISEDDIPDFLKNKSQETDSFSLSKNAVEKIREIEKELDVVINSGQFTLEILNNYTHKFQEIIEKEKRVARGKKLLSRLSPGSIEQLRKMMQEISHNQKVEK